MRLTWLPAVLEAEGLSVIVEPGWDTRGDDEMEPRVVVTHHTAIRPDAADATVVRVLRDGRVGLPGPLCHVQIRRDGVCRVIAAGRANHAGLGSWNGVTGNRRAVGLECDNDGRGEVWPDIQLDAILRANTAILRHLGLSARWACAHREWAPTRKIDPLGIDMDDLRAAITSRLDDEPMPTVNASSPTIDRAWWKARLRQSHFAVSDGAAWDDTTITAVKTLQANMGLPETGDLDYMTQHALMTNGVGRALGVAFYAPLNHGEHETAAALNATVASHSTALEGIRQTLTRITAGLKAAGGT